jgi:hypothetical protein
MSRKPKAGSSLRGSLITSASWIGNVDDAMRDFQLRRKLGGGSEAPSSDISTDKIRVKLASGGPYDIGTPLEVGAPSFSTVSRSDNWHVAALRSGNRAIGIALEPITNSRFGWLQLDGVCPALVSVGDVDHTHAYVATSGTTLTSGFGGPIELVSAPASTGSQTLLVRLGCPLLRRKAKSAATISAGSSGSASIWLDGSNVGTITAYFNWMENGIASIASGKEMIVDWFDDEQKWVVTAAEC